MSQGTLGRQRPGSLGSGEAVCPQGPSDVCVQGWAGATKEEMAGQ